MKYFWIFLPLTFFLLMAACQPVATTTPTAALTPFQQQSATLTVAPTATLPAPPQMQFVGNFGAGFFSRVFRSPDGKRIFVLMNSNELRWYDAKTLEQEGSMVLEYQYGSYEVIFGPDPDLVAVVGSYLFVINLNQKTSNYVNLNADVVGGETHFSAVQFSSDAKLLFFHRATVYGAGFGESIDAWNIHKNQQLDFGSDSYSYSYWEPEPPESVLTDPAVAQNGKWIASGYDKLVQIRDIETGKILQSIKGHDSKITHVAFSKDSSRLVSSDKDGLLYLWNSETGQNLGKFSLLKDGELIDHLKFLDNNSQILATFESGDGQIIDLQTGQVQTVPAPTPVMDPFVMLLHHQGYSQFYGYGGFGIYPVLSISPDGKTLAVASETVLLWDIQTRKLVGVLEYPDNSKLVKIKFDPTGHTLVGISGEILIWNLTETAQPNLAKTLGPTIKNLGDALTFSADGKRIAFGRSGTVEIWDIATMQRVRVFRMVNDNDLQPFFANKFSADGQFLYAATSPDNIDVWDIKKGQLIRTIKIESANAWDILTLDDPFVALGDSHDEKYWIEVWNLQTKIFKTINVGSYTSAVFNKNRDLLFTNDDIGTSRLGRFYIWQVDTQKRVYTSGIETDTDFFYYDLDLLHESNFIATHSHNEGIVKLFDISDIIEFVHPH